MDEDKWDEGGYRIQDTGYRIRGRGGEKIGGRLAVGLIGK